MQLSGDVLNSALQKFTCVYVFGDQYGQVAEPADIDHPPAYIDAQRTFQFPLPTKLVAHTQVSSVASPSDALYALAGLAGSYSRFRLDARFPAIQKIQLFRTWLDASFSGDMGDHVFAFYAADIPIGLITIKKHPAHTQVGLLAVAPDHQNKGIATALIQHARYISAQEFHLPLHVTTQAINTGAIACYTKNGGLDLHQKHVAHYWK